MMRILASFFSLMVFMLSLLIFYAEPSSSAEICDAGRERCKPLIKDQKKFERCIELMCSALPESETDAISEEITKGSAEGFGSIKSCYKGLWKCQDFREDYIEYWGCMSFTCSDPASTPHQKHDCDEGKNECNKILTEHTKCMEKACGRALDGSRRECKTGLERCGNANKDFWKCTIGICLGPHKPSYRAYSPYRYMTDSKGRVVGQKIEGVEGDKILYHTLPGGKIDFTCSNGATPRCMGGQCGCGAGNHYVVPNPPEKELPRDYPPELRNLPQANYKIPIPEKVPMPRTIRKY